MTDYLDRAGLSQYLSDLGFYTVAYGCTTCIGNSGPLDEKVIAAIEEGDLVAAGVLSGNRNFEGRIHSHVRANYLASPPLVVAHALAGTVDFDMYKDPLGQDQDGNDVFLRDIWPSLEDIKNAVANSITPEMFATQYGNVYDGNETWNAIQSGDDAIYGWSDESTYVQEPPFFVGLNIDPDSIADIKGARVLVKVGDSITTDHISPAGPIAKDSPAADYSAVTWRRAQGLQHLWHAAWQ